MADDPPQRGEPPFRATNGLVQRSKERFEAG
jgi:hypothetical protein